MSLFSQWSSHPEVLRDLFKATSPASVADYAALTVLSIIAGTYVSRGILWDRPDPYLHLVYERPQLKNGGAAGSNASKQTRNIAQKTDETGKNVVVFWGSQSGTAEGFAHRLAREVSLRFGQEAMTADLSDYDPDSVSMIPDSKLAIFILSTYGEGDPSDNTAEFWDWVHKTQNVSLSNLRYAAFGLGNSNYKFYNRVVDIVADALDRFGAKSLMPVGKANDAEGTTQEDFMSWKEDLFATFKQQLGFQEGEVKYMPTLSVQEDESLEPIDLHHGEPDNRRDSFKSAAQCSPVRAVDISSTRELFTCSDRHCLHIELDLSSQPEFTYKTGDHLAVWPGNPDAEVDVLVNALGLPPSRHEVPISITSLDPATKVKVPTPTTPIALFRYYLEICAPVNRDTLLGLSQFAPTPAAKDFLLQLGQDKTAYASFLNHTHLTLGRLLQLACPDTPWTTLPLSYLIETLTLVQPRYYSISSSSVLAPRKPSITVLVSSAPLPANPTQSIHGLTSNYLLALSASLASLTGGKIHAHLRRSRFKLPLMSKCPLVMVAAGTGLAPFRAFIAERRQLSLLGKEIGEMILFFGVSGQKVYVQDRIAEHAPEVIRLIDEGANVYICGRAGMAREVEKTVGEAMRAARGWSEAELNEWSKAIKRKNKWQEDVWG
ncbi:NADPH cytochrome P450 oxidoreductase family protein [Aspergillus novofumigatus IBT 16806]|uniref:NADPH--hemoprotein reductase n=1 Tax=Aspergillus novofumigatus (strain IBT 16806) TaxID=1392255 RepID=A0A2I1CLX0_ASPN1|nr:NADPH cytochrome P450 [Aspergillus novofumigatus IBT 16806]PKX98619.1 NADPH cytochrome P450 [Aspergillus novofumigatus IBT 16806]